MVEIPKQAIEDAIEAAGMEGWDHIEDRMRAALTAAAPHMSGVKVKPLEWTDVDAACAWCYAATAVGVYKVTWAFNESGYKLHYPDGTTKLFDRVGFGDRDAAKDAAQADYEKRFWAMADVTAVEAAQHSIGWLYHSEDAGTEFSENHPIESGECCDAKDIKPATAENLRNELLISWKAWAEDREELSRLRDALSPAREQALDDDMRMGINDLLHNLRFRLEAPEATIETDRKLVGQIIEMVDAIKSQPTYDASEPIETAPKDGTEILAWREDCGWFIASYTSLDAFPMSQSELDELDEETLFKKDWFTQDGQFRLEGNEVPIRWQPVPPAPQTGGGE